MSYWNAKFPNDHGEYEITFASKRREKTKIVEKVCQAIIDLKVKSIEDISFEPVRHGRWVMKETMIRSPYAKNAYCSECLEETSYHHNYCPNCGAHMKDGGAE